MIKKIFERTKESIRDFTSDPINHLGYLIPVLIGFLSFISGIVWYVKFIAGGGYANQIGATIEFGLFSRYGDKFTSGTTGMITAGVIGKIILILVCFEMVVMLINYFKSSGKAKRILMIVDLVIMGVQITLTTTIFGFAIGRLVISEEALYDALKPFDGISVNPKAILITYAVLTLVSLIGFIVLVFLTKECRWMIRHLAIALAIAYLGIPLVFLLLQNVIPLVTGAIALVIIGIFVFLVFKIGFSGGSADDSVSPSTSSSGSYSSRPSGRRNLDYNSKEANAENFSERDEKKRNNQELVIEDTCAYVPSFNKMFGFKLWKVRGVMHDYIASDNGVKMKEICSLEMFEKGKFHIYESESGKEIKSSQIPWMKQN